jgi:hypothetical protein
VRRGRVRDIVYSMPLVIRRDGYSSWKGVADWSDSIYGKITQCGHMGQNGNPLAHAVVSYAYPPHTCRVSASCVEGDLPTYGPVLKEMVQSFTAPPLPKY